MSDTIIRADHVSMKFHLNRNGANSLKEAEIETVADLVRLQKTDLLKYKNFSKRAIVELSEWLEQHGLSFGMNV